jgi:phosphonate degradation associated HDIG domain protein
VNSVDAVMALLASEGATMYGGEVVTQLEHALQCASLAEEAGAGDALISACLLHDLGHLIERHPQRVLDPNKDDLHQYMAVPFLRSLFGEAVLAPIRLHVEAKRYLCYADDGYWGALSLSSQQSLALQGGAFDTEQAERFMLQPFADDAVQLRRWDDRAKMRGCATPDLQHFSPILRRAALANARR